MPRPANFCSEAGAPDRHAGERHRTQIERVEEPRDRAGEERRVVARRWNVGEAVAG